MRAVLSQEQDGREVVLAYSSKALTKEVLCHKERVLSNRLPFEIFQKLSVGTGSFREDRHGALQWYKNIKQPNFQLESWIETVEEFGVKIVSRPGIKHCCVFQCVMVKNVFVGNAGKIQVRQSMLPQIRGTSLTAFPRLRGTHPVLYPP